MSETLTQFSCILDVGSAEKIGEAEQILGDFASDLYCDEGSTPGFQLDRVMDGPGALWIHSDRRGSPDHVVRFVKLCAKLLALHGVWGFSWSHPCSKPRIGEFGGGACVLDLGERKVIADVDYNSFVYDRQPATPILGSVKSSALRAFLDVSSSHLSLDTQRWLDEHFQDDELRTLREDIAAMIAGGKTRYGWFVYAPEDPMEGVPPDLERILRLARERGAEYVLFDRDTPRDPRLPLLSTEEGSDTQAPTS